MSWRVDELTSWQVHKFTSFLVHELTSSRVDEFVSFSKACEQRRYLHTIDRLLHYFSAFISMFQQRQLSNRATSPAESSNITCRIVQPQLPNYVTLTTDSRFLQTIYFLSEKTLQNVDVGDLTRASSSYYWYYRYYWYYWYIRNGVWLSTS